MATTIPSPTSRPDRVEHPAAPAVRVAVPWKTVLALAAALAFADGFWLTSLQGAVGAIERSQSPFTSWLQESAVLLPVFAVAVLGAFALAVRWFGPVLHRPRTIAATALLVVVAATVTALAATVLSAIYDYHLQSRQLVMMDTMHTACVGGCLAKQQAATIAVHVHGVVYISRWLLLTNVAVVGWLVAMWGGRLKVGAISLATRGSRARDLRLLLVGSLVAAAAVHAAAVPAHLSDRPAAGMFLVVLAIWELAVAGLLLARLEERTMLAAAAAVSLVPLLLWTMSPGVRAPDLAAGALEVVAMLAAVALLLRPGWLRRPALSAHAQGLVVLALVAVTVVAVGAVGLHWFDAFGVADARSATDMRH